MLPPERVSVDWEQLPGRCPSGEDRLDRGRSRAVPPLRRLQDRLLPLPFRSTRTPPETWAPVDTEAFHDTRRNNNRQREKESSGHSGSFGDGNFNDRGAMVGRALGIDVGKIHTALN